MSIRQQLKRISVFLKDPDKKPFNVIIKEVLVLIYLKRRFPIHYFGRLLYRKGLLNPYDYLDMKEYYAIINSKKLNIPKYIPFLEDKLVFSNLCNTNNIASPKVISHNIKNSFFTTKGINAIENFDDLYNHFISIFDNINTDTLFIKPICGYGGKGTFCLKKNNLKTQLKLNKSDLLKGSYIHQIGVIQHDLINKIYPNSVNTIRVDTYISNDNSIHILAAFMRFGTGGSVIDNVSSGGLYVPICMHSGTLKKYSLQSMIRGGKLLTHHPDTNLKFEHFSIPFYNEALELCLKLTEHIPNRLIGWDIAVTPEGPVVIEGNITPGILMGEFSIGGYLKHPLYKDIISNT